MRLTSTWVGRVLDRLDQRLTGPCSDPLAVAVSGGGDSMALLRLAAEWTHRRRRRLVVFNVDHGLSSQSRQWCGFVADTAGKLGLDFSPLDWSGAKPASGLQAAARAARHRLLADAARNAGARVILLGHTRDDVAEGEWMRCAGTPLGRLREWAPSPAWPEGRGLMLMRPLLDIGRSELRAWLSELDQPWIDDPSNEDPRFLRAKARKALPKAPGSRADPEGFSFDLTADDRTGLISGPVDTPWLSHALVCASGRTAVPVAARVAALRARLAGDGGRCSLAGAVVESTPDRILVSREAGRRPPTTIQLQPGIVHIWDGRFSVRASAPGWSVVPAAGLRSRLSQTDRLRLNGLPPAARGVHPVFRQVANDSPVLADDAIELTCLVTGRLNLAAGQAQTEADIAAAMASSP